MGFIYKKFSNTIKKALSSNENISKLVLSFCIGLYIAFSPFPGFHTIMILTFSWMFKLNLPVMFLGAFLNNPWTMVPLYTFDYSLGYWILHKLFNLNVPWGISLGKIFGSGKVCVISFLVGGNILGILAALIAYPVANKIFKRMASQINKI
jgi:uncharacterized protein